MEDELITFLNVSITMRKGNRTAEDCYAGLMALFKSADITCTTDTFEVHTDDGREIRRTGDTTELMPPL